MKKHMCDMASKNTGLSFNSFENIILKDVMMVVSKSEK